MFYSKINCRCCRCSALFIRRSKRATTVLLLLTAISYFIFYKRYVEVDQIIKDYNLFLVNPYKNGKQVYNTQKLENITPGDAQLVNIIPEVVFMIIHCEGHESTRTANWNLVKGMLKSALLLTNTKLRIIFIMETEKVFQHLLNITSTWPTEYLDRMKLEYMKTWYPEEQKNMRGWYAPCVTEKLFIPYLFSNLDAAIIIDHDIIFLGPPEEMWQEFTKFNKSHVVGMVPCKKWYNDSRNKVPFYGDSGLNGGIIYMNFTRLRQLPGIGFINETVKISEVYRKNITLAEQDILNIYFNKHPSLLYEIGCQYNYRFSDCFRGKNICDYAGKYGAFLLHGNTGLFKAPRNTKFKAVFDAFLYHPFDLPRRYLLQSLQHKLCNVTQSTSLCANLPDIDYILSHELSKHV